MDLFDRWDAAVTAGGLGAGAAALTALDGLAVLARRLDMPPWCSLAYSTAASLYRQAGRHGEARRLDGLALGRLDARTWDAGVLPRPDRKRGDHSVAWSRAALVDALVNLAADNLGLRRLGVSARLLDRAEKVLGECPAPVAELDWQTEVRPRLRSRWVAAELALYSADPAGAQARAAQALVLAAAHPATSARHRIKTELIMAAALGASGRVDEALASSRELAERASALGLLPLQWAALALRNGLAPDAEGRTEQSRIERILAARGMPFVAKKG